MIVHAQSVIRDTTDIDSSELEKAVIDVGTMRHELEAQVINTKGLVSEIKYILEQMERLIETEKEQLPAGFVAQMSELIDQDLAPCIRFQDQSAEALEKLMSRYLDSATQYAAQKTDSHANQ